MNARNDGLADLLVQLAGNAASLIEKARAAQAMRATQTVDGEAVRRSADKPATDTAESAATGEAGTGTGAQASALQDIIVQQAMRVHALEADVARLTAALAMAEAELADARAEVRKARQKPKDKPSTGRRRKGPAPAAD